MRIIQIIDSLEAGGAERMAVNYANALVSRVSFSAIVATRKEGSLLKQIDDGVAYLFLNKKKVIDFGAIFRLRKFVEKNKITIVHAHSSSFFIAFLLKVTYPSIKLIWHDHYGNSSFLSKRPFLGLRMAMYFFDGGIVVNQILKQWSEQKLKLKEVVYLPNFPSKDKEELSSTILKGNMGKRIISLANLRKQKNHFLLLNSAKRIKETHPDWTFHLIGKDFEDSYSDQIKDFIRNGALENTVYLYGSRQDVNTILDQSDIAVLTSESEGLPVSLLEYGWHKKPVVVTNVGEISMIIQNGTNGFIVNVDQENLFYDALVQLIEDQVLRIHFGQELHKTIVENYSETTVLEKYLKWLQSI